MIPDGALILTEKMLTDDVDVDFLFNDSYYRLKRWNGYSNDEIQRKRDALENMLIPFTFRQNSDLLRRNGFQRSASFFQWYNFAGFLCVKGNI